MSRNPKKFTWSNSDKNYIYNKNIIHNIKIKETIQVTYPTYYWTAL